MESKPVHLSRRAKYALLSLLLAGILLFIFLPRNAGAYRAIPGQSSVVLDCKGLLLTQNLIQQSPGTEGREILQNPLFRQCFRDVDAAFKLFRHRSELVRAFGQNRALAAFTLHPADSLHALFALELEESPNLEKLLQTNPLTAKYFPHTFHGNTIFNVHLSKTDQLEVAVFGRLLLFSRKATLVEDALAQLDRTRNWWSDRPYLSDLPDARLRLYLRPSALAEQWRGQMNARWRGLPDLLARNLAWLGFAWDGEALSIMAETSGFLSGIAQWGDEPDDSIFEVLPDNTAFLSRTGLKSTPDFFAQIGTGRSADFDQYVLPWVSEEAAVAITEPLSPALTSDRFLLLAVRDTAVAMSRLRAYGNARGTLPWATGPYQMFEVLGFQSATLLKPLLGDDEAFRNPVCALVGGHVVFAPDRSSLEILLDKYLVSQTLASNTDFLQLQQKRAEKGRASFFLNTAYLSGLLQNTTTREGLSLEWLGKARMVSVSLQPHFGRRADLHLTGQIRTKQPAGTDLLWKTPLPSNVTMQPCLIEQPGGKTFVLIQDLKYTLYCMDAENGSVRWSKPLPERILSGIRGIDYFGNGTHCYTFNTAASIFTLDENGQDVLGFPFKLPAPATNGITVVDFDKNRKFHYFVACENGGIYGFGHLGKPLNGWNNQAANGSVRQPILHFQHSGKDYLAVLTESGTLSVFGRDGSPRFEPVALDGFSGSSAGPLKADWEAAAPRIYCGDRGGTLFACDLQGKWSRYGMGKTAEGIDFGQLTGDASFEWAMLEDKTLRVGRAGTVLFTATLPEKQQKVFFSPNNRIGTVDQKGRRVWLFDANGKRFPGFPLGGNTSFEFGTVNGVEVLVVGNVNGVWAYRVRS